MNINRVKPVDYFNHGRLCIGYEPHALAGAAENLRADADW
jgi:hypothetical protein